MHPGNTSPKVSIIMPTYNRAAYIVETIRSVTDQTFGGWELIIIDDQSTDDTAQLVASVNDERVHYFRTAARLGITGTRNAGLERAVGELLAFIDSDDLWERSKLEKQVAVLEHYPDAGFCLTGGYNFKTPRPGVASPNYPGEPIDHFYKQRSGLRVDHLLIPFFRSEVSTTTSSLVVRRSCLDTTGFFNGQKPYAEVELILNLAQHFRGIILYETLFYRRMHDSNTSSATWEKGYEEGIALIHAYRKLIPGNVSNDALFRLFINFGESCLQRKMIRSAIGKFLRAWQYKPTSLIPFRKIAKAAMQIFKNP